jgi:hypothetical protein
MFTGTTANSNPSLDTIFDPCQLSLDSTGIWKERIKLLLKASTEELPKCHFLQKRPDILNSFKMLNATAHPAFLIADFLLKIEQTANNQVPIFKTHILFYCFSEFCLCFFYDNYSFRYSKYDIVKLWVLLVFNSMHHYCGSGLIGPDLNPRLLNWFISNHFGV